MTFSATPTVPYRHLWDARQRRSASLAQLERTVLKDPGPSNLPPPRPRQAGVAFVELFWGRDVAVQVPQRNSDEQLQLVFEILRIANAMRLPPVEVEPAMSDAVTDLDRPPVP